jgi:Protein of unknown function (DUF3631)
MGRNRGVCARCWYPKATSARSDRQRFVDRSAQAFVDGLDDRAFEAWEPLLAIAELAELEGTAGSVQTVRRAALILAGSQPTEAAGDRVAALTAIRTIIGEADAIHTSTILEALNGDETLPFGDWRTGAGLNARGLTNLLRPFSIGPQNVRIDGKQAKGFRREQFVDSWARYCESAGDPAFDPSRRPNPNGSGRFGDFSIRPTDPAGTDCQTPESPTPTGDGTAGRIETQNLGPNGVTHATEQGRAGITELAHKQRLEHWRARREQHRRDLEAGAPTVADVSNAALLELFPGSEIERDQTDVERAAEVIACALTGASHVIGRWWSSKPIKLGLARVGITDEDTIAAGLELLGVEVRQQGTGARWRLDHVPEVAR